MRFTPLHFKAGHWGYSARRSPFHEISWTNETFFGISGKDGNLVDYIKIFRNFSPRSLPTVYFNNKKTYIWPLAEEVLTLIC